MQIAVEDANQICCEKQEKDNILASQCLVMWKRHGMCLFPFVETLSVWVSPTLPSELPGVVVAALMGKSLISSLG